MRAIFLLFLLMLMLPVTAQAEPRCGDIEEDIVEDVFRAADRVDHYYDVEDKLEAICIISETLRKWEKSQPRGSLGKAYKAKRNDLIKGMEDDFQGVTGSLTSLRAWIHYDANGSVNEAKRIVRIRNSKKDSKFYLSSLEAQVRFIKKLMKDTHSEE